MILIKGKIGERNVLDRVFVNLYNFIGGRIFYIKGIGMKMRSMVGL